MPLKPRKFKQRKSNRREIEEEEEENSRIKGILLHVNKLKNDKVKFKAKKEFVQGIKSNDKVLFKDDEEVKKDDV